MNKSVIIIIACALVFGGAGYYEGTQHAAAATQGAYAARFAQGAGTGGPTGARGAGRGGFGGGNAVFGTIIAKDANSVTVQLGGPGATSTNGTASGTRIVMIGDSTQIQKTASGSLADLSVGTGVVVNGTANSDGSLTATDIQIRPAGMNGRGQ